MRLLVYMLFISMPFSVHSQMDSTLSQQEVDLITIHAEKKLSADTSLVVSSTTKRIDALISKQSNIYIKSYGLGSLATLSLWGGNASQTLIDWEGIPVSNPMLGLTDLSLVPLNSRTQIRLEKGGLSAEHGSGAMTGLVSISHKDLEPQQALSLEAVIGQGSFRQLNGDISLAQNMDRFSYSLNGFFLQADNDFSYKTKIENRVQSNADLSYSGLNSSAKLSLGNSGELGLYLWFQESEKGIPPTSVQTTSVARQEDVLYRAKVYWEQIKDSYSIVSHIAFLEEHNNYADELSNIDARNRFIKKIHQAEFKSYRGSTLFSLQSNLELADGYSDSYTNDHQRLTSYALFANIQQQYKKLRLCAGLRKEWRSITAPPLLPVLSLAYQNNNTAARIKFSKEFRAPTMNELFWVPGGNQTLLPEQGWSQELSLEQKDILEVDLHLSSTFFHRKIDNWILWSPSENIFYWSPFNIGAVRSYGVDLQVDKNFELGDFYNSCIVGYSYIRSENLIDVKIPTINKGDQLIYTPKSNFYLNTSTQYRNLALTTSANYTGAAKGINEDIPSYFLLSSGIEFSYQKGRLTNKLSLSIENLTNITYRVIERRPMPGRYYNLTWSIKFLSSKQNSNKY